MTYRQHQMAILKQVAKSLGVPVIAMTRMPPDRNPAQWLGEITLMVELASSRTFFGVVAEG